MLINKTTSLDKQRGIASLEFLIYVPILLSLIYMVADFYRYLMMQDKLHLTAVTIGPLAADIPPENLQNKSYENLLCGKRSNADNNIICPDSPRLQQLLKIALETMALQSSKNFAMQIEFIDRSPFDFKYAKTQRMGQSNCRLDNNTTGGITVADYLTSNKSRPPVDLKNRAQHQFIFVVMCYKFPNNWFTEFITSNEIYADSFNLRRYWYSGDSHE